MTEGERLVWAAAYAVRWSQALEKREVMGIPMSPPTCIEEAHAAVCEMRGAYKAVQDGWGENSSELLMLEAMLGIERINP